MEVLCVEGDQSALSLVDYSSFTRDTVRRSVQFLVGPWRLQFEEMRNPRSASRSKQRRIMERFLKKYTLRDANLWTDRESVGQEA
jgi:hypothetical protein